MVRSMTWMTWRPSRLPVLGLALGLALAACGEKDQTLRVTGIEPERGATEGDTHVIIKGNGFISAGPRNVNVYFGTQQAGYRKATVVRFASDSQLIVRTPGGKPNEVADVLVMFEPGGQLRIPDAFTYIEKGAPASVEDLDTSPEKRAK